MRFFPWPPFVHRGVTYDLSHLNGVSITSKDSEGRERRIAVTFSDHCFTRDPTGDDDDGPVYPGCSRKGGRFCTERYGLSLGLVDALKRVAAGGVVWNTRGDHYAVIKGMVHNGATIEYAVIFSLDKVTGRDADLNLCVRTAHRRDERPIDTFGSVRFAHLVSLVMRNQRPNKNFDRKRKRPFASIKKKTGPFGPAR